MKAMPAVNGYGTKKVVFWEPKTPGETCDTKPFMKDGGSAIWFMQVVWGSLVAI